MHLYIEIVPTSTIFNNIATISQYLKDFVSFLQP